MYGAMPTLDGVRRGGEEVVTPLIGSDSLAQQLLTI